MDKIKYNNINIGNDFICNNKLNYLNNGLVDEYGNLYIFDRTNINTHEKLAYYLKLRYYLRIAYYKKYKDGFISYISNNNIITESMAISLYNLVNNKNDNLTTFEEKLARYGTDLGYYSIIFKTIPQIYDYSFFNKNMKVLSYTLGNKFDLKYFKYILNK